MPTDETSVKFFIEAIIASVQYERATRDHTAQELSALRELILGIFPQLPNPDRIRHGPNRQYFTSERTSLMLAPTPEDPPGIPVMSVDWDFTGALPKTSVRVLIVYPDTEDDRPYRTWGFRWELPGDDAPDQHRYAHAQPISALHLGGSDDPKSMTLSERCPTFWLAGGLERPDSLMANVLVSLYGADQTLLALLNELDGARDALSELQPQ